jgi:fatty-acyl-CoA synthase
VRFLPLTVGALLAEETRKQDRTALVFPAGSLRWSYRDLVSRAQGFTVALQGAGVEPGEHVALWAANTSDWVAVQFALSLVGAVLVPVNIQLQPQEVANSLRQ